MFFENDDKSYAVVDLSPNDRFLEYKDSYNYYDIDVDNILLFKKSNNEYIIRHNDANKMAVISLQLKTKNFFGELRTYTNNDRVMYIHNDDKKLFRKCKEMRDDITESIGINNAQDFLETTLDHADEFIGSDVDKNTSFVEDNCRDKLVIALHSVIDNYLKTSLIQVKTHKNTYIRITTPINHINKHTIKYITNARIP